MEPWVEFSLNAGINLVMLLLSTEMPIRKRSEIFLLFSIVPVFYYYIGIKEVLFVSKTGFFSIMTIATFISANRAPPLHPIGHPPGSRTFVIPDPVVECKQD